MSVEIRQSITQQKLANRIQLHQNRIQLHQNEIANKKEALQQAKDLGLPADIIKNLQLTIYNLCMTKNPNEELPEETSATPVRLVPSSDSTDQSHRGGLFGISTPRQPLTATSPPPQRICSRKSPQQQHDLFSDLASFTEQDVAYDGNCGFHVMAIIHELHFPLTSQLNADSATHSGLRREITNLMLNEAKNIFLAKRSGGNKGQEVDFNVYIEDEMKTECGSVETYCNRMREDAVHCGLNEFAAFVHLLGDNAIIFYHTTKMVHGSRENFTLARETVRRDRFTVEYHVLHKDGADGKNGHFVYLKPRLDQMTNQMQTVQID